MNLRTAAHLCWIVVFVLASPPAFAQYQFDSWTTENGLPNNWIMAIHQTRDGYLWLTTNDGVARFDGVRFQIFNKVNTPGLTTNWFAYRAIWEDEHDNLWMGTQGGGVIRYHDGTFTALTTKDGLPSNLVIRIDEDSAGTVWITTGGGVVRWRNGHLVLPRSRFDRSLDAWLTLPRSTSSDAKFFGLWRFKAGQWQRFAYGHWSPLPLPRGVHDVADLPIEAIAEDSERHLWYSLKGRPHDYYCVHQGRLDVIHDVPDNSATQICCQDREGRLWMGNHFGDIGLWQEGHLHPLSGISSTNVFQAMEDRDGNLWIATLDRGLYRLRKQVITAYRRPATAPQGNVMGPILQTRTGAVWLASGGLTSFKEGRFTNYYRPRQSHKPWDSVNMVDAISQDRDGSILEHTWDGAVWRFRDGRLRAEPFLSARIKGRINVILRDRAGNLWFGGERGLYRVHNGVVTQFTARDGLPGNTVNIIEEDGAGALWIGTSGGLVQFGGGKLVLVPGVRGVCVEAMCEDKAHVWWLGTLDDGLYRLARGPTGPKITHYTAAQGLYSNRVYTVLEDDFGYLWMSCDSGLYRVRKQALNDLAAGRISQVISSHFGAADGLPGECTGVGQGMAFKARDGRLWFATQDGLAVVDARSVRICRAPPPVIIEACLVGGRPAPCTPEVRMRADDSNLEISYTAPSFNQPGQIRFNYELEGLDRSWIEAGTRRTAYYSHVPPGHYTFKVIAANSDGVWNTEGQSLSIVVLPPFYRTWWFLTLASLIAASAMATAWQYRVSQLKRANALQEAFSRQLIASQEQERQRIAAELHDSLGQTMLIIKNRASLALKALADRASAEEQLDEISASAADALEEVRIIAYNLRPHQLDRFGLTKTVQAMCAQAARSSGINFSTELEPIDGLFTKPAETNIYRVVQEAVNNIIKHSDAGEARCVLRRRGETVELIIQDDGRGFARVEGDARASRGGFGLFGMAERVRLMGGKFSVDSSPGHGTAVTVKLSSVVNGHAS